MFGKKKNSAGGGGDDESGLLAGMKMKVVEKAAPNHSLCPSLTLQQRMLAKHQTLFKMKKVLIQQTIFSQ